jgi:hypothetical protein
LSRRLSRITGVEAGAQAEPRLGVARGVVEMDPEDAVLGSPALDAVPVEGLAAAAAIEDEGVDQARGVGGRHAGDVGIVSDAA